MSLALASVTYNEVLKRADSPMWLPEMSSNTAKSYAAGTTQLELLLGSNPVTGVGVLSYNATLAIQDHRWGDLAEMSGGVVGGFVVGKSVSKYGNYGLEWEGLNLSNAKQAGATTLFTPNLVKPVVVGEVGDYGPLSARSIGDGLTPDHVPSFAAVRAYVEAKNGVRLTEEQANQLRRSTTTVVIESDLHVSESRTYGGRNTQAQISSDSMDLRRAANMDLERYRPQLELKGYTVKQIDAIFNQVHQSNQKKGLY